jgi:hypothetical protein
VLTLDKLFQALSWTPHRMFLVQFQELKWSSNRQHAVINVGYQWAGWRLRVWKSPVRQCLCRWAYSGKHLKGAIWKAGVTHGACQEENGHSHYRDSAGMADLEKSSVLELQCKAHEGLFHNYISRLYS